MLGLLASFYVYRDLQSVTGKSGSEPMIEAMVAAKDLEVGARLQGSDIKMVRVPVGALPPGSPRKIADVIGRDVIVPIAKRQFILSVELAGENAGSGLPSLIPPGMRAVVVQASSVAGFVTPGTRVDVVITGAPNGEHRTITILKMSSCLPWGTREAQTVTIATLLVNHPDDAERLILASNVGRIQLIPRNPAEFGRLVPLMMDSPMPCDQRIKNTHDSIDDIARWSGRCSEPRPEPEPGDAREYNEQKQP